VLLAGSAGGAGLALAAWLGERNGLDLAGSAIAATAALGLAASFRPDVVLLDFHRMPRSLGHTVSLLKQLSPAPLVLVLTHDASETMRRHCRESLVDAVFDKTSDLEPLATLLERTRNALASSGESERRSRPVKILPLSPVSKGTK
jgi:DNA-binding NarL/FixJ family response regulator